jgi:ribonuclease P protein component
LPAAPRLRFPRAGRLLRRSEYQRVFRKGSRSESRYLVAIGLRSGLPKCRLGLSVGRRLGGAVERNRAKRLLRECFRKHNAAVETGLDIILVAKPALRGGAAAVVESEFLRCLEALARAGRPGRARPAAGD